jgi:ribosome maturation factor RimP
LLLVPRLCILKSYRNSPFWAFFISVRPVNASSYQRLRELVAGGVERAGAHLIDLVVRGERGTRVIEVFIDSETGITSDVCSAASREVGQVIDATREIEGGYRLDVSSPGIGRPLTFPWQYRKHIGRRVEVKLVPGHDPAERTGKLVSVDDTGVTIETGAGKEEIHIPFSVLSETSVKAPW